VESKKVTLISPSPIYLSLVVEGFVCINKMGEKLPFSGGDVFDAGGALPPPLKMGVLFGRTGKRKKEKGNRK